MSEAILIALIGASAGIIAGIIGAWATIKAGKDRKGDKKPLSKEPNEKIDMPPEPTRPKNPFDLRPEEQDYGSSEYMEAMATQLLRSRGPDGIKVKDIEK